MSVLFPATGSGQFSATSIKVIRLVRYGCANRPFFHIVVAEVSIFNKCVVVYYSRLEIPIVLAFLSVYLDFLTFNPTQFWQQIHLEGNHASTRIF